MQARDFTMNIFNVPESIEEGDLRIEHENIKSWSLIDVATGCGESVANVAFNTDVALSVSEIEGNISVWSRIHDVQGVDIEIAA